MNAVFLFALAIAFQCCVLDCDAKKVIGNRLDYMEYTIDQYQSGLISLNIQQTELDLTPSQFDVEPDSSSSVSLNDSDAGVYDSTDRQAGPFHRTPLLSRVHHKTSRVDGADGNETPVQYEFNKTLGSYVVFRRDHHADSVHSGGNEASNETYVGDLVPNNFDISSALNLTTSPSNAPSSKQNLCPSPYNPAKVDYGSGSLVEVNGYVFKCNGEPYTKYCNYPTFDEVLLIEVGDDIESITELWLNAWNIVSECDRAGRPSVLPTKMPTVNSSSSEGASLEFEPVTTQPTWSPTAAPSWSPTITPTVSASSDQSFYSEHSTKPHPFPASPIQSPTIQPSFSPTVSPSWSPTITPTIIIPKPTDEPTIFTSPPTAKPTDRPSTFPSETPSFSPSISSLPTPSPTLYPSLSPSKTPTMSPSYSPSTWSPTTHNELIAPKCLKSETRVRIELLTDGFPGDTSWVFKKHREKGKTDGLLLMRSQEYTKIGQKDVREVCLGEGTYEYIIRDSMNDGLCCNHGQGYYRISTLGNTKDSDGWQLIVMGNEFIKSEVHHIFQVHRNGELELVCNYPQRKVRIEVKTDNFGEDTSWQFRDVSGVVIAKNERVYGRKELDYRDLCLEDESLYEFTIFDAYGDGICCQYGRGHYKIITYSHELFNEDTIDADGVAVLHGGSFFEPNITHIINTTSAQLSDRDAKWLQAHNIRRKRYHAEYEHVYVPLQWSEGLKAEGESNVIAT